MSDLSAESLARTLIQLDLPAWLDETFLYTLYSGGFARSNPHWGGFGAFALDDGQPVQSMGRFPGSPGAMRGVLAGTGQLVSAKVARSAAGTSEGYAYIEFASAETADGVLRGYNGHPIPNTEQVFKLTWASAGRSALDSAPLLTCSVLA